MKDNQLWFWGPFRVFPNQAHTFYDTFLSMCVCVVRLKEPGSFHRIQVLGPQITPKSSPPLITHFFKEMFPEDLSQCD